MQIESKEIASLKNLPLATIVLVEVSDFFISRFEETLFVVSKSARFSSNFCTGTSYWTNLAWSN